MVYYTTRSYNSFYFFRVGQIKTYLSIQRDPESSQSSGFIEQIIEEVFPFHLIYGMTKCDTWPATIDLSVISDFYSHRCICWLKTKSFWAHWFRPCCRTRSKLKSISGGYSCNTHTKIQRNPPSSSVSKQNSNLDKMVKKRTCPLILFPLATPFALEENCWDENVPPSLGFQMV